MGIVEIEFQPGGLGLVFGNGTSANGQLEVIAGSLYFTGLTAAQRSELQTFNSNIDASIRNYDPRFGGGQGVGINAVEDDDQSPHPKLGGFLDLNGHSIYDGVWDNTPLPGMPTDAPPIIGAQAFDFQTPYKVQGRAPFGRGDNIASGANAFAVGRGNIASGIASSAQGDETEASGDFSHAEGVNTLASGVASHAEGNITTASGRASHAEGDTSSATGDSSHAEGRKSLASGEAAHAQGLSTIAAGDYSHAAGYLTTANGFASTAIGYGSVANLYAQRAQASGYISQYGDVQRTEAIARITSTDQAWNEMFLDGDGGSQRFLIEDTKFYAITITVMGYREGIGFGAMMVRMLTIDNTSGIVTLHSEEIIGTDIDPGIATGGATGGYY